MMAPISHLMPAASSESMKHLHRTEISLMAGGLIEMLVDFDKYINDLAERQNINLYSKTNYK